MVPALDTERRSPMSQLFHFKSPQDSSGHQTKSLILENNNNDLSSTSPVENRMLSRSQASGPLHEDNLRNQQIGWALNRNDKIRSRLANDVVGSPHKTQASDMELMKDRFAKLLLGEDMSGGGKGVSSALALSNAFTNLAASVFGEQKRLEPMSAERKAKWRKEIDWLLSVTDHIVEFVPSNQILKDGISVEVMVTMQRNDLHMNVPALRKLNAMLLDCLDNFKDQNEFYYMSKDEEEEEKGKNKRKDEKWWIPVPKVPPNGLSEITRKWLQFQKDSVNQVLKAAMAINAQVLSEMEIPENYIESLPKNGRASLGESIYKGITDEYFNPDEFFSKVDLSSEHKILDLKNRIEASVVIWKRKMNTKDGKSTWTSGVSMGKREQFEERAETILLILKQQFPGIPQSALDMSKIQYNQDVGHAVLESYSRVLESLAFTVMSRIEEVLQVDSISTSPLSRDQIRNCFRETPPVSGKFSLDNEELEKFYSLETPTSMTLSDFMEWSLDQGETETKKDLEGELPEKSDVNYLRKPPIVVATKKFSYIESLGCIRSPTARH